MQKILLLLGFCVLLSFQGQAQSKMNFSLLKQVRENSTQLIDVFIQGDVSTVKKLVSANGGLFKYSSGDIASVKISPSALGKLMSDPAIKRMEAYPSRLKPLGDTMLIQTNTIPVHSGAAPLSQAYDGTGVVVGIIDTGIDFVHPDFRDSAGNSRIKFLWDQTQPLDLNTPLPYNYGQEWNNTEIDGGMAVAHDDLTYGGHGTHVAGLAVGNAMATGSYKGVAPKADIVFVAIDFTTSSAIADATDYIYAKADLLGKPCVINASLGDYYGSHDGQDLQAQLMKNMINFQPGRSFVAAVGNGGTTPYHVGYTVTGDTNFTFYEGSSIYIPMYADTNDLKFVDFAIGADQFSPHSFRGNIPFSDISTHLGVLKSDTLYNGSNRIGIIQSYGDLLGGVYSMEFMITPDSGSYKWRLMTTGTGKFDVWTFDVYAGPLPSAATMPDSIFCKLSDTDKTTVSSFQCLDDVISVGNYTNRKVYQDVNNVTYVNVATNPGALHATSSRGPTRDGRIKPDICSPGDMTLSAVVTAMIPYLTTNYPDNLAFGGYHVRNGGSSHASPSVAGIAALYLQKNPTATAAQIKNEILCSARLDSFTTGTLPDNNWGYGKSDAFETLKGCVTTGVTEASTATDIGIYPNPSDGSFTIDLGGYDPNSKAELRIFNALGELVKSIPLTSATEHLKLDLASGLYSCNLFVDGEKVASGKLVVL